MKLMVYSLALYLTMTILPVQAQMGSPYAAGSSFVASSVPATEVSLNAETANSEEERVKNY
jgi:hypothetical protein